MTATSPASGQDWSTYVEASRYLDQGLIRSEPLPERRCGRRTRREWMSGWLPRLGHPERAFGAVHVAGTSGKGSVAVMVAELLRAARVRTGLHVTPYLQVATEKLWVDGRYASAAELAGLVDWIRPHAESRRGPLTPLHGMAWVAITLEHFRRQQVQVGVVEVGVGGRHDLTTVLDTRVAVITAVGLDHLKTLGPTIEDVARHKAGVIRPGSRAVVLGRGPGLAAARSQAATVNAPLRVVREGSDYAVSFTDPDRGVTGLDFAGRVLQLRAVPLGMPGAFQADNAALALAAVEELGVADRLDDRVVRQALARARLPGRAELLPPLWPGACPVLVDGAHNPDKLAAFEQLLALHGRRARLHLVYGSLQSHCHEVGISRLAQLATTFVATEPRVYAKLARPAHEVAALARAGGAGAVVEPDPRRAVQVALSRADENDLVVVTGSLYLAGAVRSLWYPDERVLAACNSWPGAVTGPPATLSG